MATERNEDPRLSIEQIENMTPQQLAQLLNNLIHVLQRMPNEPLKNLQRIEKPIELEEIARGVKGVRHQKREPERQKDLPDWLS
jgi:hypothetical protein